MTRLMPIAAALWMAASGIAAAGQTVVVELFTSQGCSSCPPADRILSELAGRDDVIALALHVDYWDYLGWKDKFAIPGHTDRQRSYVRAIGKNTIYTPQMVIGGRDHVIGSRPMKISRLLQKHAAQDARVNVVARRNGDQISIEATPAGTAALPAVIDLVTYVPEATVDVLRGENAGRTLTYHNIVRDWARLGTWNGKSAFRATAQVPEGVPVVVLVQARNSGPILGAHRLR
ncbi:MAG: DUF1223 domain-containing protein [Boseongicola sp. SB0665_bin_10]|nr:DUF1223 domain-containing protein [Boseongicola sp. SB0665_bin_10]